MNEQDERTVELIDSTLAAASERSSMAGLVPGALIEQIGEWNMSGGWLDRSIFGATIAYSKGV